MWRTPPPSPPFDRSLSDSENSRVRERDREKREKRERRDKREKQRQQRLDRMPAWHSGEVAPDDSSEEEIRITPTARNYGGVETPPSPVGYIASHGNSIIPSGGNPSRDLPPPISINSDEFVFPSASQKTPVKDVDAPFWDEDREPAWDTSSYETAPSDDSWQSNGSVFFLPSFRSPLFPFFFLMEALYF